MNLDYEEYTRHIAHQIWLDEGCPDGEQLVKTLLGYLKLKDIHWIQASIIADIDFETYYYLNPINSVDKEK